MVGDSSGAVIVTVAEACALPPGPVQLRLNVLSAESVPVDWLPLVPLGPDHAPLAVQLDALVVDQLSVELLPVVTAVGEAASDTVGAGVVTDTDVEAGVVPPGPVQLSVKVLSAARGPVDWLPLVS
jgi:hypothetical protein